jgi:hypothetical protein
MTVVIIWLALSFVAGVIANNKARSFVGFMLLSLVLSPLVGIIAALIASPNKARLEERGLARGTSKKCPACGELVRVDASKCRYCHTEFEPPDPAEQAARAAQAKKSQRNLMIGGGLVLLAILALCSYTRRQEKARVAALTRAQPTFAVSHECNPPVNQMVGFNSEYVLRSGPSESSPQLVNEKASKELKRTEYHSVLPTTVMLLVGCSRDWTNVAFVGQLLGVSGWVPTKLIRKIEKDSAGKRIFTEADFAWDKDTSKFKEQILTIVNKITRENSKCPSVSGTVDLAEDRSKAKAPVFFVTCEPPAGSGPVFNVYFSPKDTKRDFSELPKQPAAPPKRKPTTTGSPKTTG